MRIPEQRILELVGRLYDASVNPELWSAFIEGVTEALQAKEACLFVQSLHPIRGHVVASNVDPEAARLYNEYYSSINPWIIRGAHLIHTGNVITDHWLPKSELIRTEFYTDFLRKYNVYYAVDAVLFKHESLTGNLAAHRAKTAKPFGKDEVKLLQLLMPHLQRAVQLQQRLFGLESQHEALTDVLDRLPQAIILLDQKGRVLLVNRGAHAILKQRDGLTLSKEGVLCASDPNRTAALRDLIEGAVHTSLRQGLSPGGALRLPRLSGARPLSILVTPIGIGGSLPLAVRSAAVVFVSDPESRLETDEQVISRLHGLTGAEAKLAAVLMQGKSMERAAEELQVSLNTARTHLKRIFGKTGTRRQGELVRLLLLGPASLAPCPTKVREKGP